MSRRSLLNRLWRRFGKRPAMAVFTRASAFISIVIMAFVAYLTDAHFIFPALGPMAFLVFS